MLFAWPFPEHMNRLLWPLLPAFLVAGNSTVALIRDVKYASIMPGVATGLILTASIPGGIAISLDRLISPPEGELSELSRMPEWTRSSNRQLGVEILQTRHQFLVDMKQIAEISDSNSCIYSELPSLVTAQTHRVAISSPWGALNELSFSQIQCPYYYMIPSALPDTHTPQVESFGIVHDELFRSRAPYNPNGEQLLGVFFNLKTQTTE